MSRATGAPRRAPRIHAAALRDPSSAADLADPRLYVVGPPHDLWEELRATSPVFWHPPKSRPGFWVVTRYADVAATYRDSRRFSCENGMTIDTVAADRDPSASLMLELTDPPEHSRLRRSVGAQLTRKTLEEMGVVIDRVVERVVDSLPDGAPYDFVAQVADRIPSEVNGALLGLPESAVPWAAEQSRRVFLSRPVEGGPGSTEAALANAELILFAHEVTANPGRLRPDGILRRLVENGPGSEALSQRELALNGLNLIVGGNESTRSTMAAGMHALVSHPSAWRTLRAGMSAIETAVEEVLRWTTAPMHIVRTARVKTGVAGVTIRPGEPVSLWIPSANRDEEIFGPSAGLLDLERTPNPHLAFGTGAHSCLGSALARRQLQALFGALSQRFAEAEVVAQPRWLASNFMSSPVELMVECRS